MQAGLKYVLFVAAALGAALLNWCPASAQPSVAFQINTEHTGSTTFSGGFNLPLQKAWSRKLPHGVAPNVYSSYPLIADGRVYVASTHWGTLTTPAMRLSALSLNTGSLLWAKVIRTDDYNQSGNLAYENGRVFLFTGKGHVVAFSATTGALLWKTSIVDDHTYMFSAPPTARYGKLYVVGNGYGAKLAAIDQATGKILWRQQAYYGDTSAPTVSSANTVFVAYPCQVFAFSALTGTPRWHYNGNCFGGGGETAPLYSGQLYINNAAMTAQGAMRSFALDAPTGSQLTREYPYSEIPPAFQGGIGYFPTSYKGLQARSTSTGQLRWSKYTDATAGTPSAPGLPAFPPIVINGKLIVVTQDGVLHVHNGLSGALLQDLPLGTWIWRSVEAIEPMRQGIAAGEGMLVVTAGDKVFALKPTPAP
jgi:outer membrane protein assembly factor BamB